jgi:SAM-dependent methyltransferase
MPCANDYDDARRAEAYSALEFPGTYYLAYRDLPAIIAQGVRGRHALDFGCGAGRSTRFLRALGFDATGVDISARMIELARGADPGGHYHLIAEGDLSGFEPGAFDLVLSAFAFDGIAGADSRAALLTRLAGLLGPAGRIILLVSTPEVYTHEWASFSTRAFPENRAAGSGDAVRITLKDIADSRPVVDRIWFPEDYLRLFAAARLELLASHRPLARVDEPYAWQSELSIAPWVIYVLGPL